jgi:hypothetical protein
MKLLTWYETTYPGMKFLTRICTKTREKTTSAYPRNVTAIHKLKLVPDLENGLVDVHLIAALDELDVGGGRVVEGLLHCVGDRRLRVGPT